MTPLRLLAILALAGLLAVGLGPIPSARAEDAATRSSRQHFQKGEKLFALGRFDDALVEYEKAFEAKPLPGFLFNIGQCHRNLGNLDQAIFSFRKYLNELPDAANRVAVETLIGELEAKKREDDEAARRRAAASLIDRPVVRPGPHPAAKPFYARWWFWGGVAAVAGASTGAYFLLRDDGIPATDLGNVLFD